MRTRGQTRPVTDANAPDPHAVKPASAHTAQANRDVAFTLDPQDHDRAGRGLLAQLTEPLPGPFGVLWSPETHAFLAEEAAPPSVNPSLWRQARLNAAHGLFEVAPGLWQVRGYDISNISFVAGDTGWIVIDPLTSQTAARASLELANRTLGERPVVAVIFTHSHADHFGGVLGVVSREDVAEGRCRIIAPENFLFEAVSENLLAGPAMLRRSAYQFGPLLPAGPTGHVDSGLGKFTPMDGITMIAPTEEITRTGEELVVDGVRIVFQLTPQTEAPAEMMFAFPDKGWLCTAEICTHTMHNLVPIRGAQVRDSIAWSKYIDEAIVLFGSSCDLMFASHHWPRWGRDDVLAYLERQRDLYRWIHDQTLRFANHGMTALEIAEHLELPEEFLAEGHTRGYYGDLVHNAKAVYQRYLSWYDGNPAHLHLHEPVEAGRRYVEFMGGADELLAKARRSFEQGDYRWVAQVVDHLVFADPTNTAARALQADALEQLGYQAESSTFRNAYLTGAQELRKGHPPRRAGARSAFVAALTVGQVFDLLAVRLKSEELGGVRVTLNWRFTDIGEDWVVGISNRTLFSRRGRHEPSAAATVTLARTDLLAFLAGEVTIVDAVVAGRIRIDGDAEALRAVLGHLDQFLSGFPIVEP